MGRARKQEEVKEGLPMWMGTFSDLVTLMMAFFVMLVAMANFEDTSRIEAVIESIHSALGVDGFDKRLVATAKEESFTPDVRRDDAMQPIIAKLRQAMAKHISDDFVAITQKEQELRLRLDGGVFFQPGSAALHPAALALLSDLAGTFATQPVNIRVEGFADGSGTEEANWALSSARAVAVVLALREKGPIEGTRLEAVAHGAFQPSAAATESADWSRRVEIVLQTNDMSGARAAGHWME
ncbi:MAG: OmpA family protein [Myxococcales bacterium]|nr:OmpA family protein [Myxococcales bacterium]